MPYYIRTEKTIFEVVDETDLVYIVRAKKHHDLTYSKSKKQTRVIKKSDKLEELFDRYIVYWHGGLLAVHGVKNNLNAHIAMKKLGEFELVHGAIWVRLPNGALRLESIAEMTEEGGFELL